MPLDIHSQFDKPDFQFCTKQQTCDETLIIFLPNSKHVANPNTVIENVYQNNQNKTV